MSLLAADTQAKLALYRQKAAEGTLTVEEMKEAVVLLREGRVGAQVTSDNARAKRAKKVVKTADELLGELGI